NETQPSSQRHLWFQVRRFRIGQLPVPSAHQSGGGGMIVSLIAALDRRRGIGKENRLPWRLSADMRRFRELTMGHHLIVGRKTFESIGKPLPGRQMIIVTRQVGFQTEGCFVVNSVDEALRLARERGESE